MSVVLAHDHGKFSFVDHGTARSQPPLRAARPSLNRGNTIGVWGRKAIRAAKVARPDGRGGERYRAAEPDGLRRCRYLSVRRHIF
ncbi:MAG: hypothetical protein ACKOUR_03345 [Planctomycetota bacterium]